MVLAAAPIRRIVLILHFQRIRLKFRVGVTKYKFFRQVKIHSLSETEKYPFIESLTELHLFNIYFLYPITLLLFQFKLSVCYCSAILERIRIPGSSFR